MKELSWPRISYQYLQPHKRREHDLVLTFFFNFSCPIVPLILSKGTLSVYRLEIAQVSQLFQI